MSDWEIAILKSFRHWGGHSALNRINKTVGSFIELTPHHLRATIYGGRAAYVHAVRSYVSNLCQDGYLNRARRGEYSLMTAGKAAIGAP
jgi:hypothetical protein